MSSSSKFGKIMAVLAIAVVLGGIFGWWVSHQGGAMPTNLPSPVAKSGGDSPTEPVHKFNTNAVTSALNSEIPKGGMITNAPESTEEPAAEPKGWDEKLDAVILGPEDENKKADKIIALMKTAPPEVQLEYSQHLINFVQDDNYSGAAGILTNSATPSGVATVLMNDLLNRNNNLKLPMLLAVASADDHPLKNDAKEMLELFVQEDHGTNWSDWSTAVDKWLKENSQ